MVWVRVLVRSCILYPRDHYLGRGYPGDLDYCRREHRYPEARGNGNRQALVLDEFVREVHSIGKSTSLAWRNAALETIGLLEFLKQWAEKRNLILCLTPVRKFGIC